MTEAARPAPRWVWAVIAALALTQPLVHLLCQYAAPPDTAFTGLHIPDSALFLYSLDMFPSGFHSDYATCQSDLGGASIRFYSVPHLWLYGAMGLVLWLLPGDPFLYYGLANGLGAAFYLWVVYRLLVLLLPRHAQGAFLLFALSGGPGGLLYLMGWLAGWHDAPRFEAYFLRFAVYDLMEGPHFNPVLYYPRLYYTLSLACVLGGLGAAVRERRHGQGRLPWRWSVAVALGAFLNARFGLFALGIWVLYLLVLKSASTGRGKVNPTLRLLLAYGVPVVVGVLAATLLMRLNPASVENHQTAGAMAMWFSPLVVVTWLHWIGATRALMNTLGSAPRACRILLSAGIAYLAAYTVGYFFHQLYYGNLLAGRDGSVAAAVSDWALVAALAGGTWGGWVQPPVNRPAAPPIQHWLALWLVGYTALALGGFGGGWFLQYGPQRLQVFLWLPLCALAAVGLATWSARWRCAAYGVLLAFGVTSITVATVAFQTPLGRTAARGPYPALHAEVMHVDDAALMDALGEGTVLAPAPAGDIIVRRRGNPVVFGIGSFNLTDRPHAELQAVVETFFSTATTNEARKAIAEAWCIDWIYCPRTWPVPEETRVALDAAPWLQRVSLHGPGAVYRVQ